MAKSETSAHPEEMGRQRLIEEVVRDYEQPLLRYAARILRNGTLAQDVVQNVFIKLFRQWEPGKRPSAALKPWLLRVAHNEAVDMIRAEERRKELHWRARVPTRRDDDARLARTLALQEDERQAVFESLDVLTLEERQVVLLRLQQGMSYDEIAAVITRPRGSVGAMLHVAVRKLAAHLRKEKEGA
ncbi:MAG: sigma-70 family RNA polymerase sigma factor [Kiritimatiellaeota bacterium]|nr:sigma-70 family RNA polymerase sigma factor [Kiritimatiellota bacterium]